jgi:hypothetical protein
MSRLGRRKKGRAGLDWDWFLYDLDPATTPPRVPVRLRMRAVGATVRVLWILRRRGWASAYRYLEQLRPSHGLVALSADTAVRLARREIFTCQLIVRAMAPNGLCLPRSLALATYLCSIGLPAEVTLARTRSCGKPRDTFHSWTELHGTVLNEKQDIPMGYSVLQRVSSAAARPGPATRRTSVSSPGSSACTP